MWASSVIKNNTGKQSPKMRKLSQSGHPAGVVTRDRWIGSCYLNAPVARSMFSDPKRLKRLLLD
jgi:hypothetical protein